MSGSVHRLRRIIVTFAGVVAVLAGYYAATGCSTVIIPPADPSNAVAVCVVDHGRHAELVLPDGGGGSVAWVYGDWAYFALGRDDLIHGAFAVALPTQGTLGRRAAPGLEPATLLARLPPGVVLELRVSEKRVADLRAQLEARFEAGLETRTYNRDYDLEFVKDPATYIWFHNCNVELTAWLEALGCDCRGPGWCADFIIEQRPSETVG